MEVENGVKTTKNPPKAGFWSQNKVDCWVMKRNGVAFAASSVGSQGVSNLELWEPRPFAAGSGGVVGFAWLFQLGGVVTRRFSASSGVRRAVPSRLQCEVPGDTSSRSQQWWFAGSFQLVAVRSAWRHVH